MRFWPSPEKWRAYWAWVRRLLALFLDCLVVTAAGTAALLFLGIVVDTRPEDPLFGFAILIAYFAVSNSSVTGGRSIGKRLTGLRVVGANGDAISLGRSMVRTTVMFLPLIVLTSDFRFVADAADCPGSTIVYSLIVVGIGGAAFYK